jgi:peptide/nickel transport system permease protein
MTPASVQSPARRKLRYILRRTIQAVPIVVGIVSCNFFLLHLAPGDAASVLAGASGGASEEYVAQLRQQFGLDKPLLVQYANYIANVLTLNLGYSFRHGEPNFDLIRGRLAATALLMLTSFGLAAASGTLLGMWAAARRGRAADFAIRILAVVAYAAPLFWVALMLIVLFALKLQILPTSGMESVGAGYHGWRRVADILHHLVLPATTLSLFYLAIYARLMRASVLEQLRMNYVLTAEAKGVPPKRILWRHVLRNAVLPLVTMAGLQVGSMLGGSVIVESVFGWPGLGLLAYEALFARDLNLLLGILVLSSTLVVFVNLAVDIVYAFVDPRVQLG